MPIVFRKHEVSIALPIEYGALNFGNVMTGLIFFGEHFYMSLFELTFQILGAIIILIGIGVGVMN